MLRIVPPMGCQSNNATPPGPAIAPGAESLDAMHIAETIGSGRHRDWSGAANPRVTHAVPGFDAPFFQAGLAGYSDAAMRIVARRHGCPYCVTEALLDRTLLAGGRGFVKADLGELHDNVPGGAEDHPLAVQIMGSDPQEMAAAAIKAIEQGKRTDKAYRALAYSHLTHDPSGALVKYKPEDFEPADGNADGEYEDIACGDDEEEATESQSHEGMNSLTHTSLSSLQSGAPSATPAFASPSIALSFSTVDVNLACPVKKIKSKARGGHWLAEPDGAIKILEAVREAVPAHIPCTVKLRRSFDDTPEMVQAFNRIFDAAYDMGYAWATVHARTVEQKYVGPSRWDLLREIVNRNPDRVVFGSGDIWNVHDLFRMLAYTGVSAVAVARGCIGNPWIFRQARMMLAGSEPTRPTIPEQRDVLEQHYRLALAANRRMRHPDDYTSKNMRKFGIRFAEHHPDSEQVRLRFIAVKGIEDWRRVLQDHYTQA
ncbi:MAG: tRNA-dihydrouridine synthase family protein [Phycisphaeraceae bacterium]|nr:tRNA-dihydrouridine synthase family protein [Phycisphaeraceae bacterium]